MLKQRRIQLAHPRLRLPPGQMNKLEKAYASELQKNVYAGQIEAFRFEPINLRLAPKTFYKPDFLVVTQHIEFHEVKGHWEDDARVKIKVAAEIYPWFRFIAVQFKNKHWVTEEF